MPSWTGEPGERERLLVSPRDDDLFIALTEWNLDEGRCEEIVRRFVSAAYEEATGEADVRLLRSADALTGAIDDFVRAVVNFALETAKSDDPVGDQSRSRTGVELPCCPPESARGYDRAEEWLRQTPAGLLPATAMRLWRAALKLGTFRRMDLQRRSGIGEGPAKRFLRFAEEKGKLRTNKANRRNKQEPIVYTVVRG